MKDPAVSLARRRRGAHKFAGLAEAAMGVWPMMLATRSGISSLLVLLRGDDPGQAVDAERFGARFPGEVLGKVVHRGLCHKSSETT